MLDKETKQNLEQYLALIESPIVFSVSLDNSENRTHDDRTNC